MSHSSSSHRLSHPFVPSPQWLSESPSHHASSSANASPWRQIQRHDNTNSDSLLSPIPPPPANLFPGSPGAFNVDPGVPFLATAGSTDAADSQETDSTRRNRFVGGFVSGIRDSVRRSLRRRMRDTWRAPVYYLDQYDFRDSGYGSSPATHAPVQPTSTEAQTSHEQHAQNYAPGQKTTAPYYSTYDKGYRNNYDSEQMSFFSAETASIKYGSDYAKMEAPLDSEDTLGAYIKRTKHFLGQISALPFSSKARVTYDHFPQRDLRDDPRRRPFVEWNRSGFGPTEYSPADNSKPTRSSVTVPNTPNPVTTYTPHHVPGVELDLREEFNDTAPVQIIEATQVPQRQSFKSPVDNEWDQAINANRRSRKRRTSTPFHRAASIEAGMPNGWHQHPQYLGGYAPPEFVEGSRYGPGVNVHAMTVVPTR